MTLTLILPLAFVIVAYIVTSQVAQWVKNPLAVQETQATWVWSLGQEDHLEEEMATHSCVLAWKIPWTEEPGRLWSMGSQRVIHHWSNWPCMHAGRQGGIPNGLPQGDNRSLTNMTPSLRLAILGDICKDWIVFFILFPYFFPSLIHKRTWHLGPDKTVILRC